MDEKKIKKLIKMLEESDLSELTVEEDGVKITVRKGPLTIIESRDNKEAAVLGGGNASEPKGSEQNEDVHKGHVENHREVVSPMVGTFYRSPSPDDDAFVQEGDLVEKGQAICIIEAMKLMNEISMDEKGKIVKFVIENGQSVEYGQVILLYDPVV